MSYSITEHTHRFAVWTAARAVQRSFTTTENIKYAIEQARLKEFVESNACASQDDYDRFHEECCMKIKAAFAEKGVLDVTYGRAAKIISIYLKTAIVIPFSQTDPRSEWIHPPIDSILLSKLSENEELKGLKSIRWTQLNKEHYKEIVGIIRNSPYPFNWKLEEYWKV